MVTLYFTKRVTRGTLSGLFFNETLRFSSVESAAAWIKGVRSNAKLSWELADHSFQNYFRD